MHIDSLPDELILEIFSYLPETRQSHTDSLWDLALVTQRFHSLTIAKLYNFFTTDSCRPISFLKTLSSAPHLAKHVKHVDWNQWHGSVNHESYNISSVTTLTIAAKLQTARTAPREALAQRFLDLETESIRQTDVLLCVLLSFVANIETLNISGVFNWSDSSYWLRPIADDWQSFGNLKKVTVDGPLRMENIHPVLAIPSLRTLRISYVTLHRDRLEPNVTFEWEVDSEIDEKLFDQGSSIEVFSAHDCMTGTFGVLNALKAFHALKSLDLEAFDEGPEAVTVDVIMIAILRQSNSLETLRLGLGTRVTDSRSLGCLGSCHKLHSLELDLSNFIPARVDVNIMQRFVQSLPANLACLTLQMSDSMVSCFGDDDQCVAILSAIAPVLRQQLPMLTKFLIISEQAVVESLFCQQELKSLQTAFDAIGANFTVQSSETEPSRIHILDHIEPEWVWVQEICPDTEKWYRDMVAQKYWNPLLINTYYEQGFDDILDADAMLDWVIVEVQVHSYGFELPYPTFPGVSVDEYTSEQPIWYWEELQKKRRSA